jgi:hypothetical protein
VAAKRVAGDWFYGTSWVHVFEEDTAQGAVFRPEDADIPLSRRPRERIVLHEDGSARLLMPGPDDRFVEHPAGWTTEAETIVLRAGAGAPEVRIVKRSPERLLVEMRRTPLKR